MTDGMDYKQGNYFICLIDIMGQKKLFNSIKSPNLSAEVRENVTRVSEGLKEMVKYATNRYQKLFRQEDDVGIELFSDTLLLSLKDQGANNSRLTLWFDIIIKLIFIACRYRLPFRGSIVKGAAQRAKGGTIYGIAVDEAMELEHSCADSFRIIFSNTLARELGSDENFDSEKYFETDADSAMVLNYAGSKIIGSAEFTKERAQLKDIAKWVLEQFKYFCYDGTEEHDVHADPKLARRFKMWGEYLVLADSKGSGEIYARNR